VYHARLVGAIRESVNRHEDVYDDYFEKFVYICRDISRSAAKRLMKRSPNPSEDLEPWVSAINLAIEYMDNPYRLRQEPWRSIGFTDDQRRTLEAIIVVRYIGRYYQDIVDLARHLPRLTDPDLVLNNTEQVLMESLRTNYLPRPTRGQL
jgi:hypothetical protein